MSSYLGKVICCLFLSFCFITNVGAQASLEGNLKDFNSNNLTDIQVQKFITDYESNGYTIDQVRVASLQKGMPLEEWNKLAKRIVDVKAKSSQENTQIQVSRIFDEQPIAPESQINKSEINIYGASLFNRNELTFEPNLNLPTPENYQIGPGDNLIIDIYGYAENTYSLTVSPEGNIRVPHIGLVQISGLSIEEAKKNIRKKLSTVYTTILTNETFVSISLGNIRSIKIIMIGEVFRPGTYTLPSVATIFNALNVAGGPNDNGSFRNIKLIRNNKTIAKIDIYDFLSTGILKDNLSLQDQDIIKIEPYDKRIELEGEVKNVGLFEAIDGEIGRAHV